MVTTIFFCVMLLPANVTESADASFSDLNIIAPPGKPLIVEITGNIPNSNDAQLVVQGTVK